MGHAKQARRLARTWATILGDASGFVAGEEFVHETERTVSESIAIDEHEDGSTDRDYAVEVRAELTSAIGTDWDSSGGAAAFDRCPCGHESAYWTAYNGSANRAVQESINLMA